MDLLQDAASELRRVADNQLVLSQEQLADMALVDLALIDRIDQHIQEGQESA